MFFIYFVLVLFSVFIGIGLIRGNIIVVLVSFFGKIKFVDVWSFGCYFKFFFVFKMKVKNVVLVVIKIKINIEFMEFFNLYIIKVFKVIFFLEKKILVMMKEFVRSV